MIRDDEAHMRALAARVPPGDMLPLAVTCYDAHPKRLNYILEKWASKGWVDLGTLHVTTQGAKAFDSWRIIGPMRHRRGVFDYSAVLPVETYSHIVERFKQRVIELTRVEKFYLRAPLVADSLWRDIEVRTVPKLKPKPTPVDDLALFHKGTPSWVWQWRNKASPNLLTLASHGTLVTLH